MNSTANVTELSPVQFKNFILESQLGNADGTCETFWQNFTLSQ